MRLPRDGWFGHSVIPAPGQMAWENEHLGVMWQTDALERVQEETDDKVEENIPQSGVSEAKSTWYAKRGKYLAKRNIREQK